MKDSFLGRGRGAADGRRHRLLQLHGRGHRRPRVRQAQGRDRPRQAPGQARRRRRRPDRRQGRLVRAADRRRSRPTRPTRCSPPSTSARSWSCTSTRTTSSRRSTRQLEGIAPYALTGAVIARDRHAIAWAQRGAAVRGRQLLRQRQADRRGRRASSRSAAAGPAAPTTRPAPRSTCCAGPRRGRSRRRWSRRRTTATRSWTDDRLAHGCAAPGRAAADAAARVRAVPGPGRGDLVAPAAEERDARRVSPTGSRARRRSRP